MLVRQNRYGNWVFPTRVGVNREMPYKLQKIVCFPHPRGGEPRTIGMVSSGPQVFPTRVGVNRIR